MKTIAKKPKRLTLLKLFTTFLFCLFITLLSAQEVQTDIEVKTGEYYTIKVKKEGQQYVIKIDKLGGTFSKTVTVSNLNSKMLNSFVVEAYDENNPATLLSATEKSILQSKSDLRFIELIAALNNTIQPGQNIAEIILSEEITLYRYKRNNRTVCPKKFKIKECQIVFEDGFIKSILAKGTINDSIKYFSNNYGIGITTRANVQNLSSQALFNENNKRDQRYILVSELLLYSRILETKTNDFSPADQAITIMKGETETVSKSPTNKLFTLNIFSDFAGINQNNPNGLIQTEFSKRINFWTKRRDFWFNSGIGTLTHIIPSLVISKIEQNNRFMPLSQEVINDSTTQYYVSPFESYRYSVANVTTEVNVLDIQGAAMSLHVNAFFGWALTQVKDTVIENDKNTFIDENINSLLAGGVVKLLFNPESKWGFQMISRTTHINNLNDNFEYYSTSSDGLSSPNRWLHSFEFLMTWDTGNDNKLFGRYRFNHEWGNANNNFSQFQIGYSIYLKSPNKAN